MVDFPLQRRESLVYLGYAMMSYKVNEDNEMKQTFLSNQLDKRDEADICGRCHRMCEKKTTVLDRTFIS